MRLGEPIELELTFSSTSPGKYQLDMDTGVIFFHGDRYYVDPKDGAVNPLFDYLCSPLAPSTDITGPFPHAILNDQTETLNIQANDGIRFDKTGKYQLYMNTRRIVDISVLTSQNYTVKNVSATSNIIDFEVFPAVDWTEQQIKDTSNDQLLARGSKNAVLELLRRYPSCEQAGSNVIIWGLAASPHREFVIQQMEEMLEAPTFGITRNFFRALASFTYSIRTNRLPVTPGYEPPRDRQTYEKESIEAYQVLVETMLRLHDALDKKTGKAKVVSADALTREVRNIQMFDKAKIPEKLLSIGRTLIEDFENLSPMDQFRCLRNYYQWKEIAGPEMLPALRRLYKNPPESEHPAQSPEESIATFALGRIYELAPDEGRELILDEIASLHPRVGISVLGSLPDQSLPDLEKKLCTNLKKQTQDDSDNKDAILTAYLIERYATPDIYPTLKTIYEESLANTESSLQAPLLAYFLRVQPDYGVEKIRLCAIPQSEQDYYSTASLLNKIGELHPHPVLEELAIPLLDDMDQFSTYEICQVLLNYGSEKSETALLDRYMKWHEQWKDRVEELNLNRDHGEEISTAVGIERDLFKSLVHARGWYWDVDRLEQFRPYCLTGNTKKVLDYCIKDRRDNPKISVQSDRLNNLQFSIAGIETSDLNVVKQKLAQLPPGKSLQWYLMRGVNPELERTVYDTLQQFCQEHNLTLVR